MIKRKKITANERDKIACWLNQGLSQRKIASNLQRSVSSINEEINRNSWKGNYEAIHAQAMSTKRKIQAGHRQPFHSTWIYSYVLEKLRQGWSPEQICGRLKLEFKINLHWETIYRFIYDTKNKEKRLWEYLPRKQKKRHKKYGRKVTRDRIPCRVSIHLRNKTIESRKTFGHWEGDSIIGKQIKSKVIHTEVERKTRYLQALVINSKTSLDTIQAQKKIFSRLPTKTVTMDNGLEFAKHQQLNKLGIKTFFADPYCSGQRGTNENTNGLIRRYLPKKTSFDNLTQEDLDDIVWEINNRPKKILKFMTPLEMLKLEIKIKGCSDSI